MYCRHDWGDDLCNEDKKMNEEAIKYGGYILVAYDSCKGKVYIITDTTAKEWTIKILFSSEYQNKNRI